MGGQLLMGMSLAGAFDTASLNGSAARMDFEGLAIQALIQETGNPRFVYDAYRRLIMMLSDVAFGLSKHHFDNDDIVGVLN